jgi:hypothetical protein
MKSSKCCYLKCICIRPDSVSNAVFNFQCEKWIQMMLKLNASYGKA